MTDEDLKKWRDTYTQYKKDLRDPKKFTAIFLRSKYKNNFPDEDMFYAMATEKWRGYVLISTRIFSSPPDKLQKKMRLFMITDNEINELKLPDFRWEPAEHATNAGREINEEHGGYADCKIISTTNISDILKRKDTE